MGGSCDRLLCGGRRAGTLTKLRAGAGGARRDDGQCEHEMEVVVGADAVEALEAAAEAAVDDAVLAVGALEGADGRHQGTAGGCAVAGAPVVHMAGVEAVRAVVALAAAARQRSDETLAVAAAKALLGRVAVSAPG